MDFLQLLNDSVPDAGPNARKSISDAQQRLEMLQVKNPKEAEVFSRQLAGAISRKEDPSIILEGIGKSYGMSIGKKEETVLASPPEDAAKKEALISASLLGFKSQLDQAEKKGVVVDPKIVDSIVTLAKAGDTQNAGAILSKVIEPQTKIQEATLADKESSLRAASDAAYAIKTVNDLTSSPGFSGVFGAKAGAKWWPGTEARNAEASRKAIVSLATTDSMRKFQGLGSMSDAEFAVAKSAATKLEDTYLSDEAAAKELNRLRSYFANSIRRAEKLGKIPQGSSDQMITEAMAEMNNAKTKEAPVTKTKAELLREEIEK